MLALKAAELREAVKSHRLDLSNRKIKVRDVEFLCAILDNIPAITELDVSGTDLGDEGAKALASNQTITTLDVGGTKITDVGAKALAENHTITTLKLTHNPIGDEGAKAFASNQTITTLGVAGTGITDVGAKALAENCTITTLNLIANYVTNEGARALASNQSLTTLHLSANRLTDEVDAMTGESAKAMVDCMLARNRATAAERQTDAQALRFTEQVRSRDLRGIGDGNSVIKR